jgi:hypothetical protein
MSDDREIAKRVAHILRILAGNIEENPELLKDIGLNLVDVPVKKRKTKAEELSVEFDIFEVFAQGGEQALRQKLNPLELRTLKRIIAQHGFDSSKLAEKWRTKERLVNLIIDRVTARSDKGRIFKEYP